MNKYDFPNIHHCRACPYRVGVAFKTKEMQLIKELTAQFSPAEWFRAFFNHTPTACKPSIKSGAKLAYKGGSSQEIYEALTKLKFKS